MSVWQRVRNHMVSSAPNIRRALASKWCWYLIIALFVLQAVWFVVSARYPMAFDEDFHFGLIQLHAQQWLPYFTAQPAHANQFGAIARDPSYFYHFLMSLPYRLISGLTSDQVTQIIFLRFINVGLATTGLFLAREVLKRLRASTALINTSLLLFCLIPIVPFLAAHISYDNLFVPIVLASVLLVLDWLERVADKRISLIQTLSILLLFAAGSIVKYAYLPIAVALVGYAVWWLWAGRISPSIILRGLRTSFQWSAKWQLAILGFATCIMLGLSAERYVLNVARYHTPNPDCGQVITVEQCLEYKPWARDYNFALSKPTNVQANPFAYVLYWPAGMWLRTFFAVSDTYDTQPPLPLPGTAAAIVSAGGLILLVVYRKKLLARQTARQLVLTTLIVYTLVLIAQTFQTYMRTAQPVAINGRYLVAFFPVVLAILGMAYREWWVRRPVVKTWITVFVLVLFLEGGGIMTFIIRSKDVWYWPQPAIVQTNGIARTVLQTIVIGAKQSLFGY